MTPAVAVVLLACIACIVAVLANPLGAVLALPSDDAFYYFKIAENVRAGLGHTFDGISQTNGFHPLWLVIVRALDYLAPADPLGLPVAVILLNAVLAAATLIWMHRLCERWVAPGFGYLAVATGTFPVMLTAMLNGLETGILLLSVTAFVWLCLRYHLLSPEAGVMRSLGLGSVLGVIMLCRLDTVFFAIAALLFSVLAPALRGASISSALRRMIAIGAGFTAIVGPYLVGNVMTFGHLMPISGKVKSSFPHVLASPGVHGDLRIGIALLGAFVSLLVIAGPWRHGTRGARHAWLESPFALMAIAGVMHFANAILFLGWGVYWWHFSFYALCVALVVPQVAARFAVKWPSAVRAGAVLASILLVHVSGGLKMRELDLKYTQHKGWYDAAQWAAGHTPSDAVFGIADAGLFGYFSKRRVINLDGKANGSDYLDALLAGRVEAYLRAVGVRYLASVRVDYEGDHYRIPIARVDRPIVFLPVRRAQEVFRSDPIPRETPRWGPPTMSHFVIWSWAPPGEEN